MAHQNDVAGPRRREFERWGIAPSVAFGLGTDTRFTLSYFHQKDDNIPQYGVPYFSAYGGPLPGVDTSNYYGYRNVDEQEIDVDMLTGVFEHDFSDSVSMRSLARCQQVDQLSCRRAAGHLVPGRAASTAAHLRATGAAPSRAGRPVPADAARAAHARHHATASRSARPT